MDYLSKHNIKFIDWKDLETLRNFLDHQGRIKNRKQSGLSAKKQREVEEAIKRARFMALLPYVVA
jgi:small subunit ribosomal protein S18